MTVRLGFAGGAGKAGTGEAADLAAFLGRLVRWDKAAVVRLRSAEGEPALGVFGHPPFGGVLAVRSVALGGPGIGAAVDATVSAGQLLDAVDAAAAGEGDCREFLVPASVTGPAWAGLLPPRGGWRRVAEMDAAAVRGVAEEVVAEFRARSEALGPDRRTRVEMDALAEELWGRPFGGDGVTLRVVHAAYALGFLRGSRGGGTGAGAGATEEVALFAAGVWLRLRTGYGSVVVRGESAAAGLTVSPA